MLQNEGMHEVDTTISSARTDSPVPNHSASGNSLGDTSCPPARRKEPISRSCSRGCPGVCRFSATSTTPALPYSELGNVLGSWRRILWSLGSGPLS